MPKAYDARNNALFLTTTQFDDDRVGVTLCEPDGVLVATLMTVAPYGVLLHDVLPPRAADNAGLTNALDANGRLKVIGQEVEAVKAEKMPEAVYPAALQHGTGDLTVNSQPDGCVTFRVRTGGNKKGVEVTSLSIGSLRALRDRINAHLAYVEKEGLE